MWREVYEMTDNFMWIILLIIAFCLIVLWMMRNGDYEEQWILSPGQYRVGVDIRPGRCDLIAESGGGSFTIKNRKADCWNLGSPIGITSGAMPSRFRNVTLLRGDILEINGSVKIMLAPPVPVDIKTETLGPGIYRFGVDIYPPARYDFEATSGSGEIILVDTHSNNYCLYQDMAAGHPLRAKTFDNVNCSARYELWINGSLQVKLTRSEHQLLFKWFKKNG